MGNLTATVVICTMGDPVTVMRDLANQTVLPTQVIVASEKGIVNAMNSALNRAIGDVFIRVDDDVEIPRGWLEAILEPFKHPSVAGVTGPTFVPIDRRHNRDSIRIAENPNWFLRWMFDGDPYAPAKIYKCGSVSYGSNYEEKIGDLYNMGWLDSDHLEGTNWAMRTNLIRAVGGFDPAFDGVAEWFDTDVEQKILKMGYRLVYNPEAYLLHLLGNGENFSERHDMGGRIKNWLRFHRRHSNFHPKMLIWLAMMWGYGVCRRFR